MTHLLSTSIAQETIGHVAVGSGKAIYSTIYVSAATMTRQLYCYNHLNTALFIALAG
jgi:hypothetical protein